MEKEFIPYEQALALKELGFDEPCFGYYYTLNGKDWKFADEKQYDSLDEFYNIGSKFTISAPLYQQVFRWFREKYDLRIWIESNHGVLKFEYVIATTNPNFIDKQFNDLLSYRTHEEAELACLIKLIEIANKIKYSSSDVPTYYN